MGAWKNVTNNLFHNFEYRKIVLSCVSFVVTIGFAAFEATLAGMTGSIWYAALAIYYTMLAFLRGGMLLAARVGKRHGEDEILLKKRGVRSYLISGVLLVLLTFALSGIIVLVVTKDYRFEYAGLMIYVAAVYAFVKIIFAIIGIVKARKQSNLVTLAICDVNVADALVSILALQVAMLQTFTENGSEFQSATFNAATGGVIGVLIIALGIYMTVRGICELKRNGNT